MKLTSLEALIVTLAIGLMMLILRLLPFLIFAKRKTPKFFSFVEKFIPALSIAVLFVVCIKSSTSDLIISTPSFMDEIPSVICAIISITVTAVLHIWKGNAMLSIFGGTILYMILNYFF